jgi:hypothetical protein
VLGIHPWTPRRLGMLYGCDEGDVAI